MDALETHVALETASSHEKSNRRAIYASLAGNIGIALSKFMAALLTRSSAMLSESIHSLVDTSNQVLLLLGLCESKAPADERFPYGQGKAVYFWALIAIVVFTLGGFYSFYQGLEHIANPHAVENPGVNYAILGIAFVLEAMAWRVGVKEFQQTKSLLIGEGADQHIVEGIRSLVDAQLQISSIEEITTLHMGPEYVLVNMRVRLEDTLFVCDVEQVTDFLEHQIQTQFPLVKHVYVKAVVHTVSPRSSRSPA